MADIVLKVPIGLVFWKSFSFFYSNSYKVFFKRTFYHSSVSVGIKHSSENVLIKVNIPRKKWMQKSLVSFGVLSQYKKLKSNHRFYPQYFRSGIFDHWPLRIPLEMLAKTRLCTNCLIISTASFVTHYTMVTFCEKKKNKPIQGMAPTECILSTCLLACLLAYFRPFKMLQKLF